MKKRSCLLIACLCVLPFIGGRDIRIPKNTGNKLMIVAHPDDETIFFGNEVARGGYVVVCLTNANNLHRNMEFKNLIKATNNYGIILDYPDKTFGERDSWDNYRDSIRERLKTIIGKRDWKKIVTHSPRGEYGHIHHKMTSALVASVAREQHKDDRLYCFGPYYRGRDLASMPTRPRPHLNEKQLSRKKALLYGNYPSQRRVCDHLSHILPYEKLIAYPYKDKIKL